MPTLTLPANLPALQAAAEEADLQVIVGPDQHKLTVNERNKPLFTRRPHQATVLEEGSSFVITWPDHDDGYGFGAFMGPDGERFRSFFIAAAFKKIVREIIPEASGLHTFVDESGMTIICENEMQKIIARISPKGAVQLKTEGFEGQACIAATAALQEKLGIVISDTETEEMHKIAHNAIEVGQGG